MPIRWTGLHIIESEKKRISFKKRDQEMLPAEN